MNIILKAVKAFNLSGHKKRGVFRSKIRQFCSILQRYVSVVGWLLADGMLKYKFRVIAILLTGIASGMLQGTALGQAVYYAKLLEKGEKISLFGQEFDPRSSMILVGCFAVGVLVTLILAAMTRFFSRQQAIRLNGLYEEFCSRRVMEVLGKCQLLHNPDRNCRVPKEKIIRRISHGDCRLVGRSLRILLWAITPLVEFVIFTGIMFYIDFLATVTVGCFTVVAMFFLYGINRHATSISRTYEESSPRAIAEKFQMLGQLCHITQFDDTRDWIDIPFEQGQIKVNREAYENRLVVVERSRFVTGMLAALIIAAAILYFGGKSLMFGASWGALLAYILALRRSMGLTTQLSGIITSVNRFYPQLKRYHEFVTLSGIAMQPNVTHQLHQTESSLQVSADAIAESEDMCLFQEGERFVLFSPVSVNRYTLAFIMSGLVPKSKLTSVLPQVCFVAADYDIPSVGLRSFLHFPEHVSRDDLLQKLSRAGLNREIQEHLPNDLDTPMSSEQWCNLDATLRYALALEAVRYSNYLWVMLDEQVLRDMSLQVQQYFLELLKDRIIFIVHAKNRNYERVGSYGETRVVVLGSSQLIGLGTPEWARKHKDEIETSLAHLTEMIGIVCTEESEEDVSLFDEE